jgi:hypothetical protein
LCPIAALKVVSRLVEQVLGPIVWDSSSGPYGFDHLPSFSMLDGFSLIVVVVDREWGADNHV